MANISFPHQIGNNSWTKDASPPSWQRSTPEPSSQLSPTFRHRNPAHNSSSNDFIHPPFVLLQEIRLNSCSPETVVWYSELAWKRLFTEPLQAKAEMFFQKEPNAEFRECGFKSGHLWVNFGTRWHLRAVVRFFWESTFVLKTKTAEDTSLPIKKSLLVLSFFTFLHLIWFNLAVSTANLYDKLVAMFAQF